MIALIGILSRRGLFTEVGERANFGLTSLQNLFNAAGTTFGASIVTLGIGES